MVERFARLFRVMSKKPHTTVVVEQNNVISADEHKTSKEKTIETTPPASKQKQPTTKHIIDSKTGEVVEDIPPETQIDPNSVATVQKQLPPNLPIDILKLAAQNKAFFQGIVALQQLNLDEDLFKEAIEDLKKKYYKERSLKQ